MSEGATTEGSTTEDATNEDGTTEDGANEDSPTGAQQHRAGTPAWAELGTSDGQGAVAFYAGLFGWEAENTPAGPAGTYVLMRREGKDVVALYEQDEAMRSRGVPPLWLVYIAVDDVSAAAAKVQEAGGTVHAQPFDVAEAGRMALVQDPTGAMFGLWQAGSRIGAQVLHEPGTMDWFELATNDPEKAGEFYEQVLGWTVNAEEFDGTPYTTCLLGDEPVAGILPAEALGEGIAPNWSVYFAVEDCAAAVEQAQRHGGELLFGPHEMPRVGQFAGLRDPQGAAFAVIQPTSAEADDESGDSDESEDSGEQQAESKRSDEEHSDSDETHSGEADDAQQDGTSDDKGEPNEELREKNADSGEAQADGEQDDSGVR
jgi:predicted enzyme related to lactoylglutathione lyase